MINSNTKNVYATFEDKAAKLFGKLIWLGVFTSIVTVILNILANNKAELYASLVFLTVFVAIQILLRYNKKKLAYHLLIWFSCLIMLYMIVVQGSKYYAILLLYPVITISTFLYFKDKRFLYGYLIFVIINQLIVLYYRSDSHINGFTSEMFVEYVNVIVYNIIIFAMANFYLKRILETMEELDVAIDASQKQEEKLHKQNKVLEKYIDSNKKLENYTHLASHELKAPLRSVKSFADLLQRRVQPKLNQEENELFQFITTNTQKMSLLLEDLQKLGQVNNTKLKLEHFTFEELINEILIDRINEIKDRNAQVNFDETNLKIIGQRSMLKQLFSNLISNGIKFVSKENTPIINIDHSIEGNFHLFKISDNGIGIVEDQRDKVFQIFTRLHSESEFKGSGIGLALCKKIVDLHKGIIAVNKSDLGGSCFLVRLPIE